MDFPIDALSLIPQRKPIVLIDKLLFSDEQRSVTSFSVSDDCVFVTDGELSAAGLMENIAQTCAARIGFVYWNRPLRIGVVGALKNFTVTRLPHAGETLTTTIRKVLFVEPALVVNAVTRIGEEVVAEGEMKVFLTENEG